MKQPELDYNVDILGAGFSRDAGLPLVNDFLDDEKYPDESERLRENLFSILRQELEERKLIELFPANTMEFLLTNKTRKSIGRNYSSKSVTVTNEHGNRLSDQWQR